VIYLTGDTHGGADIKKLVSHQITDHLTTEDTLIICGDFGFVWDTKKEARKEKTWLDWFQEMPWTTAFVDGNHECFPRLFMYPQQEWCGGQVHAIRPHLYHLMRGEIYTIERHTFFVMGGAASHDRGPAVGNTKSVIGKYWWPEEIPSQEEMIHGWEKLHACSNRVDYILTHCLPSDLQEIQTAGKFSPDPLTEYLKAVNTTVEYSHWYCGHYHVDQDITEHVTILFNKILKAGETVVGSAPMLGSPVYQKNQRIKFLQQDTVKIGSIKNIYPWGMMGEKTQPVYDVVEETSGKIAHYVKEKEIQGILR